MSADPQQVQRAVRQERTNEAFAVDEPLHDPRVGPRVIPLVIVALIALAIIVLLFLSPWG